MIAEHGKKPVPNNRSIVMPHTYFQYVKIYITGRSGSKLVTTRLYHKM